VSGHRSTYETPLQEIRLEPIPGSGLVIDIGGGGEGLVSRIAGARVCAVDIRMDEIREARIHETDSQWILADGQALPFRSSVFETATFWFSLEYMRTLDTKSRVMAGVHGVLQRGGRVSLLASRVVCEEEAFQIMMRYDLPDGDVSQTGYGVWGGQNQNIDTTTMLLEKTGFRMTRREDHGHWFRLEAIKMSRSAPKTLKQVRSA